MPSAGCSLPIPASIQCSFRSRKIIIVTPFIFQLKRDMDKTLNKLLLEELPKLLHLSNEVLVTCIATFIELVRKFQSQLLQVR